MKKLFADYGMLLVLLGLCVMFTVLTLEEGDATGSRAARAVASKVAATYKNTDTLLVVGEQRKASGEFAEIVAGELKEKGFEKAELIVGNPRTLKVKLDELKEANTYPRAMVAAGAVPGWGLTEKIPQNYPEFTDFEIIEPEGRLESKFLKPSNLDAIISRVVAIAIVAIGMTLVILTGGIDLSVGSLVALSAVIGALIIDLGGGKDANAFIVLIGFLGAILACGLIGLGMGGLVAGYTLPPFIVTLAFMMMARGAAKKTTGGFTIEDLPEVMTWLGQGKSIGIPNTIWLLVILYIAAHFFMTQTKWGRYIYAVGGNIEAARLSGVPVHWVIVLVYAFCGLCAGLGGCVEASQIKVGSPNIGIMFELSVIAAVVVGGTSLSGGSGKVVGTLIGALIIAVIQNGMNLKGLRSWDQEIVLGAVILGAVLLDMKRRTGKGFSPFGFFKSILRPSERG